MGFVKAAAVIMGILILAGTGVIVVTVVKRIGGGSSGPSNVTVVLDEAEGTRIVGIAALSDRLAVLMQGGGPDRIVLIDPHSGAQAGAVTLAR
jgi:hypothetical protein